MVSTWDPIKYHLEIISYFLIFSKIFGYYLILSGWVWGKEFELVVGIVGGSYTGIYILEIGLIVKRTFCEIYVGFVSIVFVG